MDEDKTKTLGSWRLKKRKINHNEGFRVSKKGVNREIKGL